MSTTEKIQDTVASAADQAADTANAVTEKAADAVHEATTPNSLSRVSNYPLVVEGRQLAEGLVSKIPYADKAAPYAIAAANTLNERTQDLQKRFSPATNAVNDYANAGLDFVENRFPAVKDTKSSDVIQAGKTAAYAPVEKLTQYAEGVRAHLNTASEPILVNVRKTHETLTKMQATVKDYAKQIPKDQASLETAVKTSQESLQKTVKQATGSVEALTSYIASKQKELPEAVRKSFTPIYEQLSEGTQGIVSELSRTDATLTEKANNVLSYTKGKLPDLINAIVKTIEVESAAVRRVIDDAIKSGSSKADSAADSAKSTAVETSEKTSKETSEVTSDVTGAAIQAVVDAKDALAGAAKAAVS